MSFFSDTNEEEADGLAADTQNVQGEEEGSNTVFENIPYYAEGYNQTGAYSGTTFASETSGEFPLLAEFNFQAAVLVLCFLVGVSMLCGWFDGWVVRNREANRFTVYGHQITESRHDFASLWRSEELEALHASAMAGSRAAQNLQNVRSYSLHRGSLGLHALGEQEAPQAAPGPPELLSQKHGVMEERREPDNQGMASTDSLSSGGHSSL